MAGGYRLIDHTADFGVEVWADDAAQLFAKAAAVLTDLLFETCDLRGGEHQQVEIDGQDWADLMVNWLRELHYVWAGRERIVAGVRIEHLEETCVRADVRTIGFDPHRHRVRHDIKAVTYHQIQVGPCDQGWCCRVIVDV
jgi:SHS2 domain-containing protein